MSRAHLWGVDACLLEGPSDGRLPTEDTQGQRCVRGARRECAADGSFSTRLARGRADRAAEFKPLFMLHNALLSAGSGLVLALMAEEVRPSLPPLR